MAGAKIRREAVSALPVRDIYIVRASTSPGGLPILLTGATALRYSWELKEDSSSAFTGTRWKQKTSEILRSQNPGGKPHGEKPYRRKAQWPVNQSLLCV